MRRFLRWAIEIQGYNEWGVIGVTNGTVSDNLAIGDDFALNEARRDEAVVDA